MSVELDLLVEPRSVLIFTVADKENGRKVLVGDLFKKIKKVVSVDVIEALGWFIEDEQLRLFDE
jgi:hypothetical protein